MLITSLVLLLSTGSLLSVESHQSSYLKSSSSSPSLNRKYHQSIFSHHYASSSSPSPLSLSSNKNDGLGHPAPIYRRYLQQKPSSPSSLYPHHHHHNNNQYPLTVPIQTAESIVEAIEESIPRTYYYRYTREPKGYHYGPSSSGLFDYLQGASSLRYNSFALSPFTVNEHVPLSPVHNGWIPKNSKHWNPGAYRSAFYTPDTRLIKFTIHDRVLRSAKKSASIPIETYVHPSMAFNPIIKSKNINKQFNLNNINTNRIVDLYSVNNVNTNYQPSKLRNSFSSKYDYFKSQPMIEESYNINDEGLIKTTTITSPLITTTTTTTTTPPTTPNSPPSTTNKDPITLIPSSSDNDQSLTSPPPLLTSQQDKLTESSTSITTIEPSLSSSSSTINV